MEQEDLLNKTVIVTGGGRGLGRAMAFGLAKRGANVCIVGHISKDIVDVKQELDDLNLNNKIIVLENDIRSLSDCQSIVTSTLSYFGKIFGLINNAALTFTYSAPNRHRTGYSEKFYELTDEIVQNVMDTNFVAADRLARLVAPHLIEQGFGRLINVTTSIETMTKYGASPYGPSKAALENASEVWVKDLEDTGVTVNILNPGGAANTEGFALSVERENASRMVGGLVEAYKMIAPCCWLLSDAAAKTTGMRFDAVDWDENKSPQEEALRVGRPLGFNLKPRNEG